MISKDGAAGTVRQGEEWQVVKVYTSNPDLGMPHFHLISFSFLRRVPHEEAWPRNL